MTLPRPYTTHEDVDHMLGYHRPTEVTGHVHDAVRQAFRAVAHRMVELLPEGPTKTIVIGHKIREAMMYANAAVATQRDRIWQEEMTDLIGPTGLPRLVLEDPSGQEPAALLQAAVSLLEVSVSSGSPASLGYEKARSMFADRYEAYLERREQARGELTAQLPAPVVVNAEEGPEDALRRYAGYVHAIIEAAGANMPGDEPVTEEDMINAALQQLAAYPERAGRAAIKSGDYTPETTAALGGRSPDPVNAEFAASADFLREQPPAE